MNSGMRRMTARLAATTLVGVVALTGATAAQAWTLGTPLGTATVSPANGTDADTPVINTPGKCADPAATYSQLVMYGSGFPAAGVNLTANNPNTIYSENPAGGYTTQLADSLANFALAQTPPVVYSGTYTIAFVCKHSFGVTDYGDYIATLTFSDSSHYTSGQAVAVPTSTTLTATPAGSAAAGSPVTLTATVSPAGAAGSVQFLDHGVALGTAAVSGTSATFSTSTLAAGSHSFTAVFTPTAPTGATPSTSAAVSFTVTAPAPVAAKPGLAYSSALVLPVGAVVICPDGSRFAVPAAAVGRQTACSSGGAYILVAKGAAPHALVAPSLKGSGKVGSKLTLVPGTWTPAYSSRSVVWKRDGKVIAKQTGPTYTVKKTDKGHRISATMVVHLAGHSDGTASTGVVKAKAAFAGSSSAVSLTTLAKPLGAPGDTSPITVPVGSAIGCSAAGFTGATSTTAGWLEDGQPYAAPLAFPIPDVLVGHTLTCRSTATNAGGTTVSDAVVVVGKGAALLGYVKPRIIGVDTVGKKLTANAGKWYPVYAKATYVWLRNGKPIKGATKATYMLKAADKKHKISVKVTVTRPAWGTASAVSPAVSIG